MFPICRWGTPSKPFQQIHVDNVGPVLRSVCLFGSMLKWPEVLIVSIMTTETTNQKCRKIFSTSGLSKIFVCDHGRQFDSAEFKNFLKANEIVHMQ